MTNDPLCVSNLITFSNVGQMTYNNKKMFVTLERGPMNDFLVSEREEKIHLTKKKRHHV